MAKGHHYAIIHWGEGSVSQADLNRRLEMLEQNMRAFYLWHALQGVALPVPDHRLIVVLANRATDMGPLKAALDGYDVLAERRLLSAGPGGRNAPEGGGETAAADAFYSPTQDMIVMSPERSDENSATFSRMAQSNYAVGWNRDDLLRGKYPKTKAPAEIARMMTFALVDKNAGRRR